MYCCDYYANFDIWGLGILVTVTSETPKAPTLFPLVPSCGTDTPQESITVGCLAKDFLPASITFSWLNNKSVNITNGVQKFPTVISSAGTYSATTQLSVSANDWSEEKPYFCLAKHPNGEKKVSIDWTLGPVEPPTVSINPPSKEDFESPFRNSTILCRVEGLRTTDVTLTWLKNGALVKSGFITVGPVGKTLKSKLTVTEGEWNADSIFTCKVDGKNISEMRNTSKSFECGFGTEGSFGIEVQTIPPSFADIYLTKSAKLTCKVNNMPTAEGLNVTWMTQNGKMLETITGQRVVQPNGLYSVLATTTVCADEWDKEDIYICTVSHPELVFPIEKRLQKQPTANSHAPFIYILSPPSEQLALHETATVTCLVKSFNPPDFFVQWLQNGEPMRASSYVTGKPILESQQPDLYFAYSTLTISEQDWNAGHTFTCVVGHEKLPVQVAQKTVDKSTGKPTHVNVSLVLSETASTCY